MLSNTKHVVKIITLYLYLFRVACQACPKICECKWKHGKVWVICSKANFIDVPVGLDSATQVLDLSNNNLKILFRDAFIDRGLINLQKVFLVNCKLKKIDRHSFRRLINLVELNLAYNLLTKIPVEIFDHISGLRLLSLKRNNITTVSEKSFIATTDLVQLDLSFNSILSLDQNAFQNLLKLEVLKLSGNKIVTITDIMLRSLSSLQVLHLHSNAWNCDCNLRPAVMWMNQQHFASSTYPKCWLPKQLEGEEWRDVDPNQLFCVPLVAALSSRMLAMNGDNVTLSCKVQTESNASVSWSVGNKTLTNDSVILEEQKYSVFESQMDNGKSQLIMSNLTIFEANFNDEGIFRCVVENEAGFVQANITLQISEVIKEDPLVANEDDFLLTGAILGATVLLTLLIIVIVSLLFIRKKSSGSKVTRRKSSENILCECEDQELTRTATTGQVKDIQSPKCLCPNLPSVEIGPSRVFPKYTSSGDTPHIVRIESHNTSTTQKNASEIQESFQNNFPNNPSVKSPSQCEISFVEVPQNQFPFNNQSETFSEKTSKEDFPHILSKSQPPPPAFCTLSRR